MRGIFLLFLSLFSFQILACSCPGLKSISQKDIDFYKAIFIGEVLEVERLDTGRYVHVSLLVQEAFKGTSGDTINLITPFSACGFLLNRGEDWLVFAAGPGPLFELHRCSRSIILDLNRYKEPDRLRVCERLEEDLRFLRAL